MVGGPYWAGGPLQGDDYPLECWGRLPYAGKQCFVGRFAATLKVKLITHYPPWAKRTCSALMNVRFEWNNGHDAAVT
jgi:hypothetical protein